MSMSRHYVSEKMLPRIASAQLYVDVVHNEDLPAAPPTAGRMAAVAQSFLPAIVSNKAFSSHDALTHIDSLLPMINSGIKESKSVVAQEIINRISINNKLLYFEMTAIRIQSAARKFLANLRVQRMKRRVELFVNITESCAARYVEEIVLATSFEICLEFYRQHNRFKMLQESVEKELSVVADELLRGLIDQMTVEVTNETISDVIDVVMTLRGKTQAVLEAELNARQSLEPSAAVVARSTNPLLVLLDQITDEAVRQAIRSVVFEAINDEVEQYLYEENCYRVYKSLLQDILLDTLVDVIQIYFGDQPELAEPLVDDIYNMQYTLFSANPASPRTSVLHRRLSNYRGFK